MKKIRNALIAALACLLAAGVSIPVTASNPGGQKEAEISSAARAEAKAGAEYEITAEVTAVTETPAAAPVANQERSETMIAAPDAQADPVNTQTVSEIPAAEQEVPDAPAGPEPETPAVSRGSKACPNYADNDGDGICDHCAAGSIQNRCPNYADNDEDGICDHCAAGSIQNRCPNYADNDGDGICDHCAAGSIQNRCPNYADRTMTGTGSATTACREAAKTRAAETDTGIMAAGIAGNGADIMEDKDWGRNDRGFC